MLPFSNVEVVVFNKHIKGKKNYYSLMRNLNDNTNMKCIHLYCCHNMNTK